jgi:hypothetical protein
MKTKLLWLIFFWRYIVYTKEKCLKEESCVSFTGHITDL